MPDCPTCGRMIVQDARYCVRCSSRLAADASSAGWSITEKGNNCQACQHAPDAEFCAACGSRLTRITPVEAQQTQPTCARCGRKVSSAAKFCSVCGIRSASGGGRGSNSNWSPGAKIAAVGAIFLALLMISAVLLIVLGTPEHTPPRGGSSTVVPATATAQSPSVSPGMGTINTGWYCALTKDAFEELTQAATVRDMSVISRLALSGEIVGLEKGTRVRILGGIFSFRIRVQDGPAEGTQCYIPTEFVTK
jgi:RNA polymerase subunit RPABC4/transcription elongation factor Spt4